MWNFASWSRPKAYYKRQDLAEERDSWDLQREVVKQKSLRSKRLHSIPEVAEEEPDCVDGVGQRLRSEGGGRPGTPRAQRRVCSQRGRGDDYHDGDRPAPGKNSRLLQRQRSSPRFTDGRHAHNADDRGPVRPNRQNTKSPDSGLDCGSEEEGSLGRGYRGYYGHGSPTRGSVHIIHCEGPVERRALALGRKRTLTRQGSVEVEFADVPVTAAKSVHSGDFRSREHFGPGREAGPRNYSREGALSEGRLDELDRVYYSPHREARVQSLSRLNRDQPLVCDSDFLLYYSSASCSHSVFSKCCLFFFTITPLFSFFYLAFVFFIFLRRVRGWSDSMFHLACVALLVCQVVLKSIFQLSKGHLTKRFDFSCL